MSIKEFIKKNLINGYKKGIWTLEEVSIMLLNYQLRGAIVEADVEEVLTEITPKESEDTI